VDCWGYNGNGELGNGTIDGPDGEYGYDTPQAVTGITNDVSVTSDGAGYCALLSTGGVDCWGYNGYGQLGNGTIEGPDGEGGYDTPQAVSSQ
jgi:alpha-tubulin suppressor-like RCC1 family protein